MKRIFLTGASGYIGGSVAARLVSEGLVVRGLVRTEDKAQQLANLGIQAVLGSLNDAEVMVRETRTCDAVIHTADADHPESAQTLLSALQTSGKPFLHTSGSSVASDEAAGEPSETIHSELPKNPVAGKVARVAIDREVLRSSDAGIRSVVICPSMIYGEGQGLHRRSIQVPTLIRHALQTGRAQHVGQGLNRWSNVHISDLVNLYVTALLDDRALGFYFAENGEATLASIVAVIAATLDCSGPEPMDEAEAISAWGREGQCTHWDRIVGCVPLVPTNIWDGHRNMTRF